MSQQQRASSTSTAKPPPSEPRPSASIVLLSPTNQVLLLHRVRTSSAFASAHVFPGGNLSEYHDGSIPLPNAKDRHVDSPVYRLGAIRETFEESGILLAKDRRGKAGALLNLPGTERDAARKRVYGNEIKFPEWLSGAGGDADIESLHPFTRWITPPAERKRFTTQMYLYMLPLSTAAEEDPAIASAGGDSPSSSSQAAIPTADGSEITTARFDEANEWLAKQRRGEIILFPPQCFLLTLVAQFMTGPPAPGVTGTANVAEHYRKQREQLLDFLYTTPTSTDPKAAEHPVSKISWADKVISPVGLLMRKSDNRSVLALEKPGPELQGSDRGGDWGRVVLCGFGKGGPRNVEVRTRMEVLAEERTLERAKV